MEGYPTEGVTAFLAKPYALLKQWLWLSHRLGHQLLEALGFNGLITHVLLRGRLSLNGFTSYGMPLKIHRLTALRYSLCRIKT